MAAISLHLDIQVRYFIWTKNVESCKISNRTNFNKHNLIQPPHSKCEAGRNNDTSYRKKCEQTNWAGVDYILIFHPNNMWIYFMQNVVHQRLKTTAGKNQKTNWTCAFIKRTPIRSITRSTWVSLAPDTVDSFYLVLLAHIIYFIQ